jgi:hypothetical protein
MHVDLQLQRILKFALNCSPFFDLELVPELTTEEK